MSDELSLSSLELKPTWRVPHLGNGGLHLEKEFANKVGIMSVALGEPLSVAPMQSEEPALTPGVSADTAISAQWGSEKRQETPFPLAHNRQSSSGRT